MSTSDELNYFLLSAIYFYTHVLIFIMNYRREDDSLKILSLL